MAVNGELASGKGVKGRFTVAIGRLSKQGEPIVLVVVAFLDAERIAYPVLDPDDSPSSTFGTFGGPLSRGEALSDGNRSIWFCLASVRMTLGGEIAPQLSGSRGNRALLRWSSDVLPASLYGSNRRHCRVFRASVSATENAGTRRNDVLL